MTECGFFDLNSPQDLFQKLQHDYRRVAAAPGDRYAAMDFVIVANHLRDWVERHDGRKVADCNLLDLCRELANNSKHFNRRHGQVRNAKVVGGGFQFPGFDPAGFDVGYLAIELSGNAEKEFGPEVGIEAFAGVVVEFWRKELGT